MMGAMETMGTCEPRSRKAAKRSQRVTRDHVFHIVCALLYFSIGYGPKKRTPGVVRLIIEPPPVCDFIKSLLMIIIVEM